MVKTQDVNDKLDLILNNQKILASAIQFIIKPPFPPTEIHDGVVIYKELDKIVNQVIK